MLWGRHGLWGAGLASNPVTMFEDVVRVPLIFNWPGRTPVQASRPEVVSLYDVLPTVCDAVNAAEPEGRNLCGRSFLPVIEGKPMPKKEPWRNLVFGHYRNTGMARDNRYKLVYRNDGQGPNELYDLARDAGEKTNLYANPQFITVRDRLTHDLVRWRKQYSS
jgi:arylsulfatase A-like enzyme